MRSEEVEIGMLVQVIKGYRKPHLQGRIGSVKQRYGDVSYSAFEVRFGRGISELFWHHELEAVLRRSPLRLESAEGDVSPQVTGLPLRQILGNTMRLVR